MSEEDFLKTIMAISALVGIISGVLLSTLVFYLYHQ